MLVVSVPKDLTHIKTKVVWNFTKRQLICGSMALVTGLPVFFIFKTAWGVNAAAYCMIFVMIPWFLLAMYEKHGQPLEMVIWQIIRQKFLRPPVRIYRTDNFYTRNERKTQQRNKEEKSNESKSELTKTDTGRTEAALRPDTEIQRK